MMSGAPARRLQALGIRWDDVDYDDVKAALLKACNERQRLSIGYANMHSAYLAKQNADLQTFLDDADIVYADGFPLVLWRKILWGDVNKGRRFTLSQALPDLLASLETEKLRLFYLGSERDVLHKALARLSAIFPRLAIAGASGFFDKTAGSTDNSSVISEINAFDPDVLMVGMGSPRQEIWVLENAKHLSAPVIYCVGGSCPSAWCSWIS